MKRSIFLIVLLSLLSYSFSSLKGFQPGAAASVSATPILSQTPQAVITPSATPVLTSTPAPIVSSINSVDSKLEAFIRVPSGTVPKPYVILTAYQAYPGAADALSIRGTSQNKSFECPSSPCELEFPVTGSINFRAYNASGSSSDEVQANIQVTAMASGGYAISIVTLGKFVFFSDSCSNIWQNAESIPPSWARFPQDPAYLNTEKSLHYLASRLLSSGVVNAKECPGGGYDYNAPNACGLAKARDEMTNWQNQYDLNIWLAGRDEHIPPILLKTLIEVESQFWPTTQRLFLDEIGLGQINQLGIDVLMRTNPDLYYKVCSSALYKCDQPYVSLSSLDRGLIRGAFVQSLDAACSTCLYGVDLSRAAQSISTIAKVLYANCVQTKSILSLNQVSANYEDSWKFTLVSYHSGFGCLQSAIQKSAVSGTELSWDTVSKNLSCTGGIDYVDKFWGSLTSFDNNLKKPVEVVTNIQLQTPTPAPPTPTYAPLVSSARIVVKIFVDKNNDGIRQDDETLDNVLINLTLQSGSSFTQVSKSGIAIFDLTGVQIGMLGRVTLPGFYRSAPIQVPASGDIPITFIFTKPALPTQFP
jgi:hypothetical protein